MKVLRFLLVSVLIIGGIGYGVYYFGSAYASEKVMDAVFNKVESSGQLEEVKEFVAKDSEIKKLIQEGATVDENKLPFTTKEQAVRTLIPKFGLSEIQQMQQQAQNGMTASEQQALLATIEEKLTAEEISALKFVIYKELNK